METSIQLKLFATLAEYTPPNAHNYPVPCGITVREMLETLNIPLDQVKLIFINNVRAEMESVIQGGERVGIFPPVGGG